MGAMTENMARIHVRRRTRRREWPEHLAELLGKIPDRQLARKAGISASSVGRERSQRGIPPWKEPSPAADWTPERVALLGKDTDARVAAALGISKEVVGVKRRILGIPAYGRVAKVREWTDQELALLGTRPDREVAEAIDVNAETVRQKRLGLRIPSFRPPRPQVQWTEEALALLGVVDDGEIARMLGASRATVTLRRSGLGIPATKVSGKVVFTAELIRVLRRPTREVARRTGLSESTITTLRLELGMINPPRPRLRVRWKPEVLERLGTVPDGALAKEQGVTTAAVRYQRHRRGIAPWSARSAAEDTSVGRQHARKQAWWTPEEEALLGTRPDEEVAQLLRRTVSAVQDRRIRLGIEVFREDGSRARAPWSTSEEAMLGTAPDEEIAQKLKRTVLAVKVRRGRRGIPLFRPRRRGR